MGELLGVERRAVHVAGLTIRLAAEAQDGDVVDEAVGDGDGRSGDGRHSAGVKGAGGMRGLGLRQQVLEDAGAVVVRVSRSRSTRTGARRRPAPRDGRARSGRRVVPIVAPRPSRCQTPCKQSSAHLISRRPPAGDLRAPTYDLRALKTASAPRWATLLWLTVVEIKGYRGEEAEERRPRSTPPGGPPSTPRHARSLGLRRAQRDPPDRGRLRGHGASAFNAMIARAGGIPPALFA